MPFDVSSDDGILTLTLDTPKSPVNVFNHATAHQLCDILSTVTPRTTRAIVFETAKPNSFINGVGLLLAQASQTCEDIVRASTPPWKAYRAVRDAPVPTIAVVNGNCFGCGVEFALNCEYRIATDTCETQFYMTELNDYLFIPLFGGTWNLPEAVGLEGAIDLLLWGERWSVRTAHARGLVDEVVPYADRAQHTRTFLQRVLAGREEGRRLGRVAWSKEEEVILDRSRQRIAALPPSYHEVYTAALELLVDGARQKRTYAEHQREELRHSAASALSSHGKSAFAFFYLRQMAGERAAGRFANGNNPAALSFDVGDDIEASVFVEDVSKRKLAGEGLSPQGTIPASAGCDGRRSDLSQSKGGQSPAGTAPIAVQASFAEMLRADTVLYAPNYRAGGRLIELATRKASRGASANPDETAQLARTLQRLGFEVARTTPVDGFVSTRLLLAYFTPLVRFVADGGGAATVNGALRMAGFVRRPHHLLATFDRAHLAARIAKSTGYEAGALERSLAALGTNAYADTSTHSTVIDALCVSLLQAVLTLRAQQEVRDSTIVDLIARELLDFPRHLCSLCSWLKRARVVRAIQNGPALRAIVSEQTLETAHAFVAEGREFYR